MVAVEGRWAGSGPGPTGALSLTRVYPDPCNRGSGSTWEHLVTFVKGRPYSAQRWNGAGRGGVGGWQGGSMGPGMLEAAVRLRHAWRAWGRLPALASYAVESVVRDVRCRSPRASSRHCTRHPTSAIALCGRAMMVARFAPFLSPAGAAPCHRHRIERTNGALWSVCVRARCSPSELWWSCLWVIPWACHACPARRIACVVLTSAK